MDCSLPSDFVELLAKLDDFIGSESVPLQQRDDNERFFDNRRECARTDFGAGGTPRREREEPLREMFRRADRAGWLRYGLLAGVGGGGGSNVDLAVIREHLSAKGPGLHNDLHNEAVAGDLCGPVGPGRRA